ncbi:hypothetical protein [Saccharothrix xinjiangensis]|uniref:Uncharacterized protein n=1 Tax=Saccharothrix xinjiangensis TaxID=204798 RepID=A0ABV9Y2M1_9PSEU
MTTKRDAVSIGWRTSAVLLMGSALGSVLAVPANAQSGDDIQRINEFLCEKDRSDRFLSKFADIQDRMPYTFRPSTLQPHRATREQLYDDPELTNRTRRAMCANLRDYNDALRRIMHLNQGEIEPEYDTEDELMAFYDRKIAEFDAAIEEEESSPPR